MIEITKVENGKDLERFMQFRYDLYRDDPNDVPYLHFDEKRTLRKDCNASFEDCEADYFLAVRDGEVVGRVAAIINHKANQRWQSKTVRFGWFDFVDDTDVSQALLQTVEKWGRDRGMTQMSGPLGFADTDREGMLIEGHDTPATMYANHNHPYYARHIEAYGGFRKDNDYVQLRVKVPEEVPEKIVKVAGFARQRYNLQTRKLTRREISKGNVGKEIFNILNITYNDLYGFAALNDHKIEQLVEQYVKIANLDLITLVVDANADNKMVGFGITFPSLSAAMRHTRNGRLLPFGWLRLLRAIFWHHADTVDMLLIGVLPEYRAKGANALIFNELVGQYIRHGFKWAQSMPQMETNNRILSNWNYFEASVNKRLRCFTKDI